jgi:hypothetical protein
MRRVCRDPRIGPRDGELRRVRPAASEDSRSGRPQATRMRVLRAANFPTTFPKCRGSRHSVEHPGPGPVRETCATNWLSQAYLHARPLVWRVRTPGSPDPLPPFPRSCRTSHAIAWSDATAHLDRRAVARALSKRETTPAGAGESVGGLSAAGACSVSRS